jgi:hypothetical protein
MSDFRYECIIRYYDLVKEQYPQLTEAQCYKIINDTFYYFRGRMADDDLPDVRLKGFGSFQIFAAPVLQEIAKLSKIVRTQSWATENSKYFVKLKALKNYVEKNPTLFEEYYKRRKKSK